MGSGLSLRCHSGGQQWATSLLRCALGLSRASVSVHTGTFYHAWFVPVSPGLWSVVVRSAFSYVWLHFWNVGQDFYRCSLWCEVCFRTSCRAIKTNCTRAVKCLDTYFSFHGFSSIFMTINIVDCHPRHQDDDGTRGICIKEKSVK